MGQSAVSSMTADGLSRAARPLRHLVAGEWRNGDRHVPFGGAGRSAYGLKEQGRAAREFFTRTRTVSVRPSKGREQ